MKQETSDVHGEALENDVCFILTSAFLIFTMQTGYGLLESGTVSRKNEVNILLKNAVNIICGSLAFWVYGFAFASTPADVKRLKTSIGDADGKHGGVKSTMKNHSQIGAFFRTNIVTPERFFVHLTGSREQIGTGYAEMAFQLAYATTCTAIVSGAMAERIQFIPYFIFSFFSNILFCLPARWTMFNGWLNRVGAIDIGGSGTVHLVGGCAGFIAALLLGPRLGRFDDEGKFNRVPMGNPTNVVHGIILLWWGWLGYSAGSTFGITGDKWKYASRASVAAILSSMAGGSFGMIWSAFTQDGLQDVKMISYSILAGLVAISGGAPIIRPIYSIITGIIASFLTLITIPLVERMKVDDPTDSFSVHGIAGAWGLLAIGLFADVESVIHHKSAYTENINISPSDIIDLQYNLLLAQMYAVIVLVLWSVVVTFVLLLPLYYTIGLRMPTQEEILGPDFVEHGLIHDGNRQLLAIIKQKIRLHHSGMSEKQMSAVIVRRFEEQQRLSETRKRSLTGHTRRSASSSIASGGGGGGGGGGGSGNNDHSNIINIQQQQPTTSITTIDSPIGDPQMWPKIRAKAEAERASQCGRYYHNHERKHLSIRSIMDYVQQNVSTFGGGSTDGGQHSHQQRDTTWARPTTTSASMVWFTRASHSNPAATTMETTMAPSKQLQHAYKSQLGHYLEAAKRTRDGPNALFSSPTARQVSTPPPSSMPPIQD